MELKYEIDGIRQVGLRFEQFPDRARKKIMERILGLTERLHAAVEGAEPDRTGALRAETKGWVDDGKNYIVGRVGLPGGVYPHSDYGKAAALEYGSHHPFQVKAHEARLAHFWGRAVAPTEVFIRAHSRTPNIAARLFLRSSLDAMRGEIIAELEAALAEATEE